MKPTPIATPVKAFEAIAPATNLKPITNTTVVFEKNGTGQKRYSTSKKSDQFFLV